MAFTQYFLYVLVFPLLPFLVGQTKEFISSLARQPGGVERYLKPEVFKEVPVLCYHQVRDWKPADSRNARNYIVPPEKFREQIALLRKNGYHFILPDHLLAYNQGKAGLPAKSLILTFDDATASQYSTAVPELNRYQVKAVFFIMTVVLNRPGYMSSEQVKTLANAGHVIGCHTWDHHDVRRYGPNDWTVQLTGPKKMLEQITGRPVSYFAYPFGAWNKAAIDRLQEAHFSGAFQLAGRPDTEHPQFTIRRILVDGYRDANDLLKALQNASR